MSDSEPTKVLKLGKATKTAASEQSVYRPPVEPSPGSSGMLLASCSITIVPCSSAILSSMARSPPGFPSGMQACLGAIMSVANPERQVWIFEI
jgi:hypothetical protein